MVVEHRGGTTVLGCISEGSKVVRVYAGSVAELLDASYSTYLTNTEQCINSSNNQIVNSGVQGYLYFLIKLQEQFKIQHAVQLPTKVRSPPLPHTDP